MSEVIFNFTGKNFLVVGASSGMGRQIALELAEAGAHVLTIARNQERLLAVKNQYSNLIDTAILDVTTATDEDWEQVISNFVKEHGKINGGVYTAGTGALTPLRSYDEGSARNVMETGFWGAIKSLQISSKKKYSNPESSYVIFSSISGHAGDKGQAIYSATKAAIRMAARSFCHDLSAKRSRINTISPGLVRTNMTVNSNNEFEGASENIINSHLLGTGEPSDVSGMVLFLLSDRAKWITGEDFIIDGGLLKGVFN